MARPTHIDSQRIMSLLEETQQKFYILSWLSEENLEHVVASADSLSHIIDPEMINELSRHLELITRYNEICDSGDNRLIDAATYQGENEDEVREVCNNLEKSTTRLTRWLLRDQDSFKYLEHTIRDEGTSGVIGFIDVFRDLRKLMLTKLLTPIDEENSRQSELEEINEKLTKAKTAQAAWSESLTSLRKQREAGRENRSKEIKKLKEELHEVRGTTDRNLKRIENEYEAQFKRMENRFLDEAEACMKQTDALKKEVDDLIKDNKEKEQQLLKQKAQQRRRLEEKVNNYDQKMIEDTETLERERKTYNEKRENLEMLDHQIRELRIEKARMMEEAKREMQRRKNYEEMLRQRELAAEYVQAHWKGLKNRAEYEKLKKARRKRGRRGGKR